MSTGTKEPVQAAEGLELLLPPHLVENFEKAEREIQRLYGLSPGVPALVRLWAGCGSSSEIRKLFEQSVLEIANHSLRPHERGYFDDDEP